MSAFVSQQLGVADLYPFCPDPLKFFSINNLHNYCENNKELIAGLLGEMDTIPATWEPRNKSTRNGYQTEVSNILEVGKYGKPLKIL